MRTLGLILIALLVQQQPRTTTSSIRGVVLRAGTTEPVAKAVVQLRGGAGFETAVATGTDGRFEFAGVPAGRYELTAARSGYLDTAFGQRGPSGKARSLTVDPSVNLNDIRLQMTQTGTISGRVLDASGEPLAYIPVQALKYSYVDGQRSLSQVKVDETNDLGEFRLFWLPPGEYMVRAQPQQSTAPNRLVMFRSPGQTLSYTVSPDGSLRAGNQAASPVEKLGEAFVPVYYPGTANPQSASRVEVRPGADVRGIDFTLSKITTRTVRGTIIDSTTGQPASVANVQLVPRGDAGGVVPALYGSVDRGAFQVTGVLPGSYFLEATARLGPRDDIKVLGGRAAVDVGSADVENVSLTMASTVDIAGSLTVEGRSDGLPGDAHPVFGLRRQGGTTLPSLSESYAQFHSGTQFEFVTVVEGDYRVMWDNLPPNTYVKSIRLGPFDALNDGVHVEPRLTARFEIVLGSNPGVLEGVVLDGVRNPVPGARVTLVPDAAHRDRSDLYYSAFADESGRFHLEGIPPGDYLLFGWEDVEDGLWRDAEFIRRRETSGRPVRVTESTHETIEVRGIPSAY